MKKNLLITGASSEIGIRLLEEVCGEYQTIYLQYRKMNDALEKALAFAGQKTDIVPFEADLLDQGGMTEMLNAIKNLENMPEHVVHLPAPKMYQKQFHKDQWDNFQRGWDVSVQSIVRILQILMPQMAKKKHGRIIFMLTSCTCNIPPGFQSCYVTVKYALLGLMKALSAEYAGKGITVNGVSPDMIETKFLSEIPKLVVEKNASDSPLGRNIYIEEVIPVIKYMLSEPGAAMTGQNIGITGGL